MRRGPSRAACQARRRAAGRSAAGRAVEDGRCARPSPKRWLWNVRRWYQRAGFDLALELVQLGLQLRGKVEVVDCVAGAFVRDAERQRSARELVVDDVLDRGVGGDVDLLKCARDDRRVGILLVGVHTDAVDARLTGRLQHPESATAGDLEEDVGSGVDLA